MQSKILGPKAWASRLTQLLDATGGPGGLRFPVDVAALASWYSHCNEELRKEPIIGVSGGDLDLIDGCLIQVDDGPGWAILYNDTVLSPGRMLHTQAHEWGHYLLHRSLARQAGGLRCSARDIAAGQGADKAMEREADQLASALLMPLNDFRKQVSEREVPDLHRLSEVADRYGTSLVSTTLKWLEMTGKRALVVSSDADYLLWARSSTAALKSGIWLKATNGTPREPPLGSLLAEGVEDRRGSRHSLGVWFGEASQEMCLVPDNYDFRLSVVVFEDRERFDLHEEDDPVAQAVDTWMER